MMRKRYLLVAMDMSGSAPGTVFRTLSKSMYNYADIDILSPKIDNNDFPEGIRLTRLHRYRLLDWPRTKKTYKRIHFNYNDLWWILVNLNPALKSISGKRYDGVISMTSMNFFASIKFGEILAKILRVPWSIYSVDGIPSPVEWLEGDKHIHELLSSHINKNCRCADFFFSSNEYMMKYQQRICYGFKGRWNYLYTPYKPISDCSRSEHSGYHFLYTGSLYGLRRIDGLLSGFRRFIKDHPGSQMIFVGAADPSYFEDASDLIENQSILIRPYCDDLTAYYADADVLVDIGADIPNDVFLSSKIVAYLPVDRPILAVTGENSPARGIMGGLKSIIHSGNDEDEIYHALQSCILAIGDGIDDRAGLLDEFNSDTIAGKLLNTICSI